MQRKLGEIRLVERVVSQTCDYLRISQLHPHPFRAATGYVFNITGQLSARPSLTAALPLGLTVFFLDNLSNAVHAQDPRE